VDEQPLNKYQAKIRVYLPTGEKWEDIFRGGFLSEVKIPATYWNANSLLFPSYPQFLIVKVYPWGDFQAQNINEENDTEVWIMKVRVDPWATLYPPYWITDGQMRVECSASWVNAIELEGEFEVMGQNIYWWEDFGDIRSSPLGHNETRTIYRGRIIRAKNTHPHFNGYVRWQFNSNTNIHSFYYLVFLPIGTVKVLRNKIKTDNSKPEWIENFTTVSYSVDAIIPADTLDWNQWGYTRTNETWDAERITGNRVKARLNTQNNKWYFHSVSSEHFVRVKKGLYFTGDTLFFGSTNSFETIPHRIYAFSNLSSSTPYFYSLTPGPNFGGSFFNSHEYWIEKFNVGDARIFLIRKYTRNSPDSLFFEMYRIAVEGGNPDLVYVQIFRDANNNAYLLFQEWKGRTEVIATFLPGQNSPDSVYRRYVPPGDPLRYSRGLTNETGLITTGVAFMWSGSKTRMVVFTDITSNSYKYAYFDISDFLPCRIGNYIVNVFNSPLITGVYSFYKGESNVILYEHPLSSNTYDRRAFNLTSNSFYAIKKFYFSSILPATTNNPSIGYYSDLDWGRISWSRGVQEIKNMKEQKTLQTRTLSSSGSDYQINRVIESTINLSNPTSFSWLPES
jgi:hypothetical protein